jgi:hypothetical protein
VSCSGDRTGSGGGEASEGEDIEIIELGLDEAHEMVRRGEIRDAKTIMLIQWALLEGVAALKSLPS